ncbi:unnamed protein product [Sympodiomycopsis kandeliae]
MLPVQASRAWSNGYRHALRSNARCSSAAMYRVAIPLYHTEVSKLSRPFSCSRHVRESADAVAPPTGTEHLKSSSEADGTQGSVDANKATGYLYFDSLYPIKLGFWDIRHWFVKTNHSSLLQRLKTSLPAEDQVGHDFKVIGAEERLKDGGAFLSFTFSPLHRPAPAAPLYETRDEALQHIEQAVKSGLKRTYTPTEALMLSWGTKPSVHVVKGKPWLEDLNRYPALGLRVNLSGGDLSEEQLWALLRPYGRIVAIEKKPNEAVVLFSRMRSATSARNCAHGVELTNGARLVINYKGTERAKQAWEWTTNHPRIVLPALAFLLGGFTYAIFDPIREFFIESKLSHTFDFGNYKLYTWLKQNTVDLILDDDSNSKKSGIDTVDWFERRAAKESIQSWLRDQPETFVTITGPRGSGKHKLLESSIPKDRKVLRIDCAEIARSVGSSAGSATSSSKTSADEASRGAGKMDTALISALASEVGYYPLFSWLNSFNSMIDLAAVGLIGSKAGFSKPAEEQLGQILEVTSRALSHIKSKEDNRVAKAKARRDKQGSKQVAQTAPIPAANEKGNPESGSEKPGSFRDEVPLEPGLAQEAAAAASRKDDGLNPKLPIIVIDNFHLKSLRSPLLYSILVQWSSQMISSRTAHVIFVSDNPVASSKEISRALPDSRPVNNIVLADAEKDRAREFVRSRLREARGLSGGSQPEENANAPDATLSPSSSSSILSSVSLLSNSGVANETTPAATVDTSEVLPESDAEWVDKLGGRLTDLETLLQKVSLGQTVPVAVSDLISRTTIELRKSLFGDGDSAGDGSGSGSSSSSSSGSGGSSSSQSSTPAWSRSAAWSLIKLLSSSPSAEIPYHWLLYSDSGPFKGSESILRSMEENEIISVKHSSSTGRPSVVRAGRPILLEAMRSLVNHDETFNLTQELLDGKGGIAKSEGIIKGLETEIKSLTEVVVAKTGGKGILARLDMLSKKLDAEQNKVVGLEGKVAQIEERLRALD